MSESQTKKFGVYAGVTLLTKMVRESASSVGGPVLRTPTYTSRLDKGY